MKEMRSHSRVCPYSLPRSHKKPESYLRVIAMEMGLSRTRPAQAATSFQRLHPSALCKAKYIKQSMRV